MRKPFLVTAGLAAAASLVLAGCTDASQQPTGEGEPTGTASVPAFDASSVQKDEAIAALVPAEIAADGVLTVGTEPGYAPAEFLAADGTTIVGLDVDLITAVGRVLGLEADLQAAEFPAIIPAVGTRYEVGVSAFTITPERLAEANMISYFDAGSQFAVPTGNPQGIDLEALCGLTVAVQTGTIQDEDLGARSAACEAAGEEPIDILRYDSQADATTNLVGGKADLTYADSPVIAYAVEQTGGRLETLGDVFDSAPYGIVVAKDDTAFAEAVQAAVQKLIDDGTYAEILATWGNEAGAVTTAELNP